MSARPAALPNGPVWRVLDCRDSVVQRCHELPGAEHTAEPGNVGVPALAAHYHLQTGGRNIRAHLALDAAFHLGLSAQTAIAIASCCELLHNASLIHDDVQDRDSTRRGAEAVWKTFGDDIAICTGDLLLSAAYAALAGIDDPESLPHMLALVHRRIAAAIRGQSADIAHRSNPVKDVDTYLRIVTGKSGALLSLPLELALLASGRGQSTAQARDAAEAFAIGYQIADDLDDIGKDSAKHGGAVDAAPTLNIALLLQPENDADVHQQCIALARRYLNLAAIGAASLPLQCGNMLARLATDMNGHF